MAKRFLPAKVAQKKHNMWVAQVEFNPTSWGQSIKELDPAPPFLQEKADWEEWLEFPLKYHGRQ